MLKHLTVSVDNSEHNYVASKYRLCSIQSLTCLGHALYLVMLLTPRRFHCQIFICVRVSSITSLEIIMAWLVAEQNSPRPSMYRLTPTNTYPCVGNGPLLNLVDRIMHWQRNLRTVFEEDRLQIWKPSAVVEESTVRLRKWYTRMYQSWHWVVKRKLRILSRT